MRQLCYVSWSDQFLEDQANFGQQCENDLRSVPELRMANHHPPALALPYREGGQLWQVLYVIVDQVSQSAG